MRGINLLPDKSRIGFQRAKIAKRARQIAFSFLGLFLLIVLLVTLSRFYFSRQVKKNSLSLVAAQREFAQFLPTIDEQQNLRLRIKLAAQILEKRFLVSEQLDQVNQLLGEEGFLSRLTIKNKEIQASGVINDYVSLKEIEERIEEEKREKSMGYDEIEFDHLRQDKDGHWKFSLGLKKK